MSFRSLLAISILTTFLTACVADPSEPIADPGAGETPAAEVVLSAEDASVEVNEDGEATFEFEVTVEPADAGTPTIEVIKEPANGTLTLSGAKATYKPAADFHGADSATLRATLGEESVDIKVAITVNPVNDAPAFTPGAAVVVAEDSGAVTMAGWATGISAGPGEDSQQVTATLVNDNTALFTTPPALSADGTLTFTTAPDANGVANVTVTLKDDGGVENDGVDTATPVSFTITVSPVNDPPTVGAIANVTFNEGNVTPPITLTGISAGPGDESAQAVTFSTSNSNPSLFSIEPAATFIPFGSVWNLVYAIAPDANGTAVVSVTAWDNGGSESGGVPYAEPVTFTITMNPVNDAPSFTKGANDTVLEDSGTRSISGWATGISAGPANEASQAVTFSVVAGTPALFSVQPAVASDGTLSYTVAANANGSSSLTVRAWDSGGTANGGVNFSGTQSASITVTAVNDAPGFTVGSNQTVLEDAASQSVATWVTGIGAGPADEAAQAVTFSVSTDNAGLFAVQPAVSAAGTLTYSVAGDQNGSATLTVRAWDNGGTANGGANVSAAQQATVTVTGVNDAPSFSIGANQSVLEDAGAQSVAGWATGISAGPADEAAQAVTFSVTTDNAALFISQPAVASNGTLSYTAASHANGVATLTVRAWDNGGTADGGVNFSATGQATITVTAVNDAPSFTIGSNHTVLEDSGAQSVANWVTAIGSGPADESAQAVTFSVSTDNAGLFAVQPAVSAAGTLTYSVAGDQNGSATLTVRAWDNGGTANGGANVSAAQQATVTVTGVNDAPSFSIGANQSVLEDAGARSVVGWATAISAGSSDEAAQEVTFSVTTDNAALFSAQPAVASNGTLTYTTAADENGVATLTVRAWDNGGTANGGVNFSATQQATITVTAVNDAPSFSLAGNPSTVEDAGAQSLAGWATEVSSGPADESAQAVTFSVTTDNAALFSVQPAVAGNGTLSYTVAANANGMANLTVRAWDNGGTANGGTNTASRAASITVNSVNDAPSFTKGGNILVNEDTGAYANMWATAISPGASESDVLTFVVSNSNNALFDVQPAVSSTGELTFTPAADAFGTATVTVTLTDDGGTAHGGVDQSASVNFTIQVVALNDAPSFTAGGPVAVHEDSGAYLQAGWASAIAAGPANEVWQTVSFSVTTSTGSLFSVQPAISGSGALGFTPAPDANGAATLYIRAQDNGGTALGGVNVSAVQTVVVTVNSVNDAPSFTKGSDVYVSQSAGAQTINGWATNLEVGPSDEAAQTFALVLGNDNNALFDIQPALDNAGTLTFTPNASAVGQATVTVTMTDSGGTGNGGSDTLVTTFVITVDDVNDPPSFSPGGNVSVLEDSGAYAAAWATSISSGVGESGQALTFVIDNNTNPVLFASQPTVSSTGVLYFTPAANVNGSADITLHIEDDGGASSAPAVTFTISVDAVNDAPTFANLGDRITLEDSGLVEVSGWAYSISAGPGGEGGQNLSFNVTNDNPALFSQQPSIDATGKLRFVPAPDANGYALVTVSLADDGGVANGGQDTSSTAEFYIDVLSVNDAPSFTALGDITIDEGDPLGLGNGIPFWITDADNGPANEFSQGFWFSVTTDSMIVNWLWLDPDGTLYFDVPDEAYGVASVYVDIIDSGGTAHGGINTQRQVFTLTINSVNDAPTTRNDAVTTTVDTPIWIHPTSNDWDADADPLWLAQITTPSFGTAVSSGNSVYYTPNAGYTGPDSFSYRVTDANGGEAWATVEIYVGNDGVGPALVSMMPSAPSLNREQAFGAGIAGEPQLSPLVVEFDDVFLDCASFSINASFDGVSLLHLSEFFVDCNAGVVEIYFSEWMLPFRPEGGTFYVGLTGTADLNGNPGDEPSASFFYDGVAPVANFLEWANSPSARAIVSFNEPMDLLTSSGFVFEDQTAGEPIELETVNGSGWFSWMATNDAYFAVPKALLPTGNDVRISVAAFTDLSGNPVESFTAEQTFRVCCAPQPEATINRIQFIDRSTNVETAILYPEDIVNGAFVVPGFVGGSNDIMRVVFDQTLDRSAMSQSWMYARSSTMPGDEVRANGIYTSVLQADDAVEFDFEIENPGYRWAPKGVYEMRLEVQTPWDPINNIVFAMRDDLAFAVLGDGNDVTAPTLTMAAGRRGEEELPVLRREEPLFVGFSELVDGTSLTPANFILSNGTSSFPVTVETMSDMGAAVIRPVDGQGRFIALPDGDYTLSVSGVRDLADPQNTSGSFLVPFKVAGTTSGGFHLLHYSPQGGRVRPGAPIELAFSDAVSAASLTDLGAQPGFLLEEKWGEQWIPLKGLAAEARMIPGEVLKLRNPNGMWWGQPEKEYRLTLLDGLRNVDGEQLVAFPTSVTFATGNWGTGLSPSFRNARVSFTDFYPGTVDLGGMVLSGFGDLWMEIDDWDGGDSWTYGLLPVSHHALVVGPTTETFKRIEIGDPSLDSVLPPGNLIEFFLTVSDSTGNTARSLMAGRRLKQQTLLDAQPVVVAGSHGPGTFVVTGSIPDVEDAESIGMVGVFISVADTSYFPPRVYGFVMNSLAQPVRHADGTLSYEFEVPADRALPPLPMPLTYVAGAMLQVPLAISEGGNDWQAISVPSAPFNP